MAFQPESFTSASRNGAPQTGQVRRNLDRSVSPVYGTGWFLYLGQFRPANVLILFEELCHIAWSQSYGNSIARGDDRLLDELRCALA